MKSDDAPKNAHVWQEFAAFVGITIAGLAVAIFGVLAPLLVWALQDGDLSDRRMILARYRAVAAQENAVRDYVRQVKEKNAHGDLLEGASAGIVAAALQSRLKAMGEAAGVTVLSIHSERRERTSFRCSGTTSAMAWARAFCSRSRVIHAHSGRASNASTFGSSGRSGR